MTAFSDAAIACCSETPPRIDYRSGALWYREEFDGTKLVGRGWSSTGAPAADQALPDYHFNVPCQAFSLEISGQSLDWGWQWVSAGLAAESPRHSVIELRHSRVPLRVRAHTALDGTPFLRRWLEIANDGAAPLALADVDVFAGVLAQGAGAFPVRDCVHTPYSLGFFAGNNWAMEGRFVWENLTNGVARRLEMLGPYGTSGYQGPHFFVRRDGEDESYFVFSLAWSGPWKAHVLSDAGLHQLLHVRMGPAGPAPLRLLAAGETVATPAIHIGHLQGDFDACIQATHEHVRRAVVPRRPAHHRHPMVEFNSWSVANLKVDEPSMLQGIETARRFGAELYMQDAGWYGKGPRAERDRSLYTRFTGDWVPGEWFPRGFRPAVARIHELGMLFGLWIEPEGIGCGSEIYREHPDWIVSKEGKPLPAVYERFNLDYTHPAAVAWLENELERVVRDYEVDVLRLDGAPMAAHVGEREVAGHMENTAWRHVDALYGILDRLQLKFPELLIENCCGGGGRLDWGIMARTHFTQFSDEHRPAQAVQIINGITMMLPPELCVSFFAAQLQGQPGAGIDTMYRALILGRPIPIQFKEDPAEAKARHYLGLFKSFLAPMLPTCRVYHHTPVVRLDGPNASAHCVIEYAAADASRSSVWVFRFPAARGSVDVRPRGLADGKRYRVTADNDGTASTRTGADLRQHGVTVTLEGPLSSEWLRLEEEG